MGNRICKKSIVVSFNQFDHKIDFLFFKKNVIVWKMFLPAFTIIISTLTTIIGASQMEDRPIRKKDKSKKDTIY